jgi:hypothetical protein
MDRRLDRDGMPGGRRPDGTKQRADKYPQIPAQRIVSRNRPAHLLIEPSRRAQLVVGGSRGHGELAGLVLGSVSNALVHKSVCPVAVVRPSSPQSGPELLVGVVGYPGVRPAAHGRPRWHLHGSGRRPGTALRALGIRDVTA